MPNDPLALLAVPTAYTAAIMQIVQALKTYLLEPYVPGFRIEDAGHDRNLRLLVGALEFVGMLLFVLSGRAGVPLPVDWYGWLVLLYSVACTAGGLTGAAHVAYQQLQGPDAADDMNTGPEAVDQPAPLAS